MSTPACLLSLPISPRGPTCLCAARWHTHYAATPFLVEQSDGQRRLWPTRPHLLPGVDCTTANVTSYTDILGLQRSHEAASQVQPRLNNVSRQGLPQHYLRFWAARLRNAETEVSRVRLIATRATGCLCDLLLCPSRRPTCQHPSCGRAEVPLDQHVAEMRAPLLQQP